MTRPFNPEMLVIARESRGRTQADVAREAGVTQGLISKAEHGLISEMGDKEMEAIARYLQYPMSMLQEPGRVREVGSACLYHRKRKTLPAKVLQRLDARMFVRNVNVRRLLDGLDIEGDRTFHTLDVEEYGSATEVARVLRATWRVPDGPIPNLTKLIESAGGIVIFEDFGHRKLFGMSCWTTRSTPLFFLNASIPTADLRWTLAHELGHLTMHHSVPVGDPEREADEFAGEFLAPRAAFGNDCRRLTFDRLPTLKAYWRLSMKAIITRAAAIGAVDQPMAVRLYKQHSARGYNSAEPFPIPEELPSLVGEAIRVHLDEHGYSNSELAEAMLLSDDEFATAFLDEERLPENVRSLFSNASRGLVENK